GALGALTRTEAAAAGASGTAPLLGTGGRRFKCPPAVPQAGGDHWVSKTEPPGSPIILQEISAARSVRGGLRRQLHSAISSAGVGAVAVGAASPLLLFLFRVPLLAAGEWPGPAQNSGARDSTAVADSTDVFYASPPL